MPNNQRLNATITIGGALQRSFKRNIGFVQASMDNVGSAIGRVSKRQRELAKQRNVLVREGRAVDHLDREYEDLGRTLDSLRDKQRRLKRATEATNRVGRAYGRVQRDVGGIIRTGTIVVGGATAAVFGLAKSTADLGDDVAKTADKLGIGTTALQEYRFVAERAGVAQRTFDMAMQRSIRRISEAAQGTGEAQGALRELGLDATALANMTPDEALLEVADAMNKVERQSDRVRLSFKLFDSEGVAMVNVLRGGSKEINRLRAEARATGYVLSEQAARDAEKFTDQLLDTKLTLIGLKNTIGSALLPVVTDFMKEIQVGLTQNRQQVVAFAKSFATGVKDALPAIGDLVRGTATLVVEIGKIVGVVARAVGGFENLAKIVGVVVGAKIVVGIIKFGFAVVELAAGIGKLVRIIPFLVMGIKAIGVALLANPIGLTIAAIAGAVVGAAFLIYKYWDPIKEFFTDFWGGMLDGAKAAFTWIADKGIKVGRVIYRIGSALGLINKSSAEDMAQSETALAASETIKAVVPRTASGSTNNNVTHANRITINAQPGQSPQDIVDEMERRQRARERGALFDNPLAYGVG